MDQSHNWICFGTQTTTIQGSEPHNGSNSKNMDHKAGILFFLQLFDFSFFILKFVVQRPRTPTSHLLCALIVHEH